MNRSRVWRPFLLLCVLLLLAVLAMRPLSAQGQHHAALVVDFGDGRVLVRVVAFAEETISGVELLQRSGLNVALVAGLGGTALCAVEGVGCPPTPQDCFCQCRGGACRYWSYFLLQGETWVYSSSGASGRLLRDGDMDGWVWGDGRTPPPLLTWDEIRALAPTEGPAPASPVAPTDTPRQPSPRPTTPAASSPTVPQPTLPPVASPSPRHLATLPVELPATPSAGTPAPANPLSPAASMPLSASPTPGAEATGGHEAGGANLYQALGFGALVVVLLGLALWVRRRR